MKNPPHIVVIGAGFAGLAFCRALPPGLARITLIDRTNHHVFQPLLYQVAGAGLSVPEIAQPVRALLRERRDITVLLDEITAIDPAARTVTGGHGPLSYDHLILAAGGLTNYFGHPEWEQHAPGLKTLDDAVRIRRDVLLTFERAENEPDPERRRTLETIVVIGGGPTGIELAGAFAELARHVLARDFRRIDTREARIVLIEGGPRLLTAYDPVLSAKADTQLEELGVEVKFGQHVKDIRAGEVELANGEILRAGAIVWGAGVRGVPLAGTLGAPLDRAGRVQVGPDAAVPAHPEIFALGDLAALTDAAGKPVPGVAPAAMQMGKFAARIIAAELRAEANLHARPARPAFRYVDKGSMATIGRSRAVAQVGRLRFSGFVAWVAWLGIHLVFLVGLRNRVSVFFNWVYSYLTYRRGARVVYGGK